MATYPALVQLLRLLGRDQALAALGLETEPDPDALSDTQRERLAGLVEANLDAVVAELVQEAASSDDVFDAARGRSWIADRVAGYRGLITDDLAAAILAAAEGAIESWG
ncbi:MAG: hypothetical protein ACYDCQ_17360 [Dehalococcoidia bacterium]